MKQCGSSDTVNKRCEEVLIFTGGRGCDINKR